MFKKRGGKHPHKSDSTIKWLLGKQVDRSFWSHKALVNEIRKDQPESIETERNDLEKHSVIKIEMAGRGRLVLGREAE